MSRYQAKHKYDTLKSDAIDSLETGAAPSAADAGTAYAMSKVRNPLREVKSSPKGEIGPEFTTFEESKPLLTAASGIYKYIGGVTTVAAFGYTVWDDCHHNHSGGRIVIDAIGIGIGVAIGVALAPFELTAFAAIGASAATGFVIGMGTSALKRGLYGD